MQRFPIMHCTGVVKIIVLSVMAAGTHNTGQTLESTVKRPASVSRVSSKCVKFMNVEIVIEDGST